MSEKLSKFSTEFALFDEDLRARFTEAIRKLSRAVTRTLGPSGSYVIIGSEDDRGGVRLTKDGFTVAKSISTGDRFENVALNILREASIKTNGTAGDGTTTSIVLVEALLIEGYKRLLGHDARSLIRGMGRAEEIILSAMRNEIIESNEERLQQIATISTDNDPELGRIIASALSVIDPRYGMIAVEDGRRLETTLEITRGLNIDRGYLSSYFVKNGNEIELDDVVILITEKLNDYKYVLQYLDYLNTTNRSGLIIAEDIDKDILRMLIINNSEGTVRIAAIKTPGYGENRLDLLEDIAIFTGSKILGSEYVNDFRNFTNTVFGSARKVIVRRESTSIIEGNGKSETIAARLENIKERLAANADNEYAADILRERYSKLTGGAAVIRVGGTTPSEISEKKDRVLDAVYAVKGSIEEGVCLGGGITFLNIYESIRTDLDKHLANMNESEKEGMKLVFKALIAPLRQLLDNSDYDTTGVINRLYERTDMRIGFNILTGEYVDMLSAGILDSVKATRIALTSALSVARLFLNTHVVILEKKKTTTS